MSSASVTSDMKNNAPVLLSLVELGGYPDFTQLYQRLGFSVTSVSTSRKAIAAVKKQPPDVVVAEFNFQSDFRDRTSSLESLLASTERHGKTQAIIFYEKESQHQLEKLLKQFAVFKVMAYPVDAAELEAALQDAQRNV
jgi:DNA-binding NtrC family response regulator